MKNQKERRNGNLFTHQPLIDQLVSCGWFCENCMSACLQEGDVNMMARCIELDRDCADVCFQAARLLARGSDGAESLLVACAALCKLCAQECRKHEADHCQQCANACDACAQACQDNVLNFQTA